MKAIRFAVLLMVVVLMISCGKKTDPVSKDNFIIPEVAVSDVLSLEESGVVLRNTGKKYNILVEKAEVIDSCTGEFKILGNINPGDSFVDVDVSAGKEYVYGFYNVDNYLKLSSSSNVKKVIYSKPVWVKDFSYETDDTGILKAHVIFSDVVNFFKIFLNGKEVKLNRGNDFEILMENIDSNLIEITPYDNYMNRGVTFSKNIVNKRKYFISSPSGFRNVKTQDNILISWDKIKGAKGYRVYFGDKTVEVPESYVFVPGDICKIYISSFNEVFESPKAELNLCP